MCQDRNLVHMVNRIYWRNLEIPQGDPLHWIALHPHVQGRVPELQRLIQVAVHHAGVAEISKWAADRGLTAWDLRCVIACLNPPKITVVFAPLAPHPVRSVAGTLWT